MATCRGSHRTLSTGRSRHAWPRATSPARSRIPATYAANTFGCKAQVGPALGRLDPAVRRTRVPWTSSHPGSVHAGLHPRAAAHRAAPAPRKFESHCHIVIRSCLRISIGIERLLAPGTHNTGRHASPPRAVAEAGPPPKMMKTKGAAQKARMAFRRPQIIVYFNEIIGIILRRR